MGNERDKAVYSAGGGGGEEGNQLSRGLSVQASAGLSFRRTRRLCVIASHTREGAGVRRVPDWHRSSVHQVGLAGRGLSS